MPEGPVQRTPTRSRSHAGPFRMWSVLVSILFLASCVPVVVVENAPRYDVLILGSPSSGPVPGAAAALSEALEEAAPTLRQVPSDIARFTETRASLTPPRVAASAARAARSLSAESVVVIDTLVLERLLEGTEEVPVERIATQFRIRVVDAQSGLERATFLDQVRRGERILPEPELPPLDEDPLFASLRARAVAALTPTIATFLTSR